MAIIRLDCNLNGGDSVTPNNELFYRIYGDVDAYASPIHTTGTALSDANVTVNNDNVIITGVDGTTNTTFKIAAVDTSFNEGVLSDAVGGSTIIFEDDFAGTTLNPPPEKWVVTNPSDAVSISQNDSLIFDTTGNATISWGDNNLNSVLSFGGDWAISIDFVSATGRHTGTVGDCRNFGLGLVSIAGSSTVTARQRLDSSDDFDLDFYGNDSSGTSWSAANTNFLGVDPVGKTIKVAFISGVLTVSYWSGSAWVVSFTSATISLDNDMNVAIRCGDHSNEGGGTTVFDNFYLSSGDFSTQYPQ